MNKNFRLNLSVNVRFNFIKLISEFKIISEYQMQSMLKKPIYPFYHLHISFFQEMKLNFEFWMEFYGKIHSKFELVEGDFLDAKFREGILASTIIFVNNFAFGPEVDQRLKDVFADLTDGSRIFSSKSFCALNFRITERNLSGKFLIV